jgi:UDP-N-acetylmuramoylalanine--D-glutamate ligase
VANALAALALGYSVGLPLAAMTTTLQTFKGLPHRCELVAQHEGVRYVNDSKGTNVGSVEAALRGLGGERDIILIAGGQGKGADFSQLQQAVTQHCKALVLIGEDASLLQQVLHASAPVTLASSMEEAVTIAVAAASFGDTVLLSPACASFDMFTGYVHRGEAFRNAVEQLSQEGE